MVHSGIISVNKGPHFQKWDTYLQDKGIFFFFAFRQKTAKMENIYIPMYAHVQYVCVCACDTKISEGGAEKK